MLKRTLKPGDLSNQTNIEELVPHFPAWPTSHDVLGVYSFIFINVEETHKL